MQLPDQVGWLRIGVLYCVGSISAVVALLGGALAWEAISWQPTHVAELPPMLLQFCVGGATATAAGLLAACCLVPAFVYHMEKRFSARALPNARLIRG